ncbi:PD-(D/E)XK motif protein [Corynebacterium genitalium ATCC 33030]|uniref:PD-(D/E)XK motif protein n=1 Tax=Corynebacterium genitalium ATCC 33030 TaxID=585529 RepID=D7WDK9_9CORY|nr:MULTISPECIES: PD-(D/E)XK motif protein [Corynebacterium]EFK54240.1 hypothetical protein HMPREF0291_11897 [Corynebacterium genitalium ATCC 33030]MCQ4621875.1 PD-(D/E)XK motif protein [Corynebacterium sp. CCUG 70398]UUA90234.1 PD-(D/E)XK motif protein [Corynebacterium genitalium ATCC 33030]
MNLTRFDLHRAWNLAAGLPNSDEWNAVRLGLTANGNQVLLALDVHGLRHLLVPAKTKRYSLRANGELNVEVGQRAFKFFDDTTEYGRYVDIACLNPNLNDQFDHLVLAVLERLDGSLDGAEEAVLEVAKWRTLFATLAKASKLTVEEKIGAFAEIFVLESVIRSREDFSPESWTGPQREPHDFELSNLSIEVKGFSQDKNRVRINGLRQLDQTDSKPLLLVMITVEAHDDGFAIGELLDRVISGRVDEHALRQRAAMSGVFGSSEDSDRFVVKGAMTCWVEDPFPRITGSAIECKGITNVHYDISLNAVLPFMSAVEPQDLGGVFNE